MSGTQCLGIKDAKQDHTRSRIQGHRVEETRSDGLRYKGHMSGLTSEVGSESDVVAIQQVFDGLGDVVQVLARTPASAAPITTKDRKSCCTVEYFVLNRKGLLAYNSL